MKITLSVDDELLATAQSLSKIKEKNALVNAGLEALVQRLASERLAGLSGTMPNLKSPHS